MRRWLPRVGVVGRPAADDRSGPGIPPSGSEHPLGHAFEPWTYPSSGRTVCIHLEGGRSCDRPEYEHAPTPVKDAGA